MAPDITRIMAQADRDADEYLRDEGMIPNELWEGVLVELAGDRFDDAMDRSEDDELSLEEACREWAAGAWGPDGWIKGERS